MEKIQSQAELGIIKVLKSVILMFILSASFCVIAEAEESGSCGIDVEYTLDDDGLLTIKYTGSGASDWYDSCISSFIDLEENNSSVKNIVVENGILGIDGSVFQYLENAESIQLPSSLLYIGTGSFMGCTSLKSINIPSSVTTMEGGMHFYGCSSLESAEIYANTSCFGGYAFTDCSSLTNVILPDSLTSIDFAEFGNCSSLSSLEIPSSVETIGEEAFMGCTSLENITLPASLTYIGASAFKQCTSLAEIEIPYGVTEIYENTFSECTSLAKVTIPNSVESIEPRVFFDCAFSEITIPDSVTSIGYLAFECCENLSEITIPESVTSLDTLIYCGSSLEKIYCSAGSAADDISLYAEYKDYRTWDGDLDNTSSNYNFVYTDEKAVKNYDESNSAETVYYISGLTGVDENDLAGYSKCNLCNGDDVLSSEYTVYEGFEIDGVEFSADEMGYSYIIGFKISDSGDDDVSADDIKVLSSTYSLKLV